MDPVQPEASVVQTGLGIRYIGEHCYALSGQIGTNLTKTTPYTMLNFSSGSGYIIAKWTVCGAVNQDGESGTGGIDQFYLSFNGISIQSLKTDTGEEDQPGTFTVPIIIPPFTQVLCEGVSSLDNSNWTIAQTIVGRVYGVE